MSIYTQPDRSSIAIEGLKLAGHPSGGSSADQTLAQGWIEEAKMDIWNVQNRTKVKMKQLLVTAYGVATENISRYANPNDCDEVYSVSILTGDEDTASAVSTSSVTGATGTVGKAILLTSGTGIGNCSQISSIVGGVNIITPDFNGSSFDGTEDYMVITESKPLVRKHPKFLDEIKEPYTKDEPKYWIPQGQGNADTDETGEFEIYPVPDTLYGLKIRYYMNIMLLDLSTDANLVGGIYRQLKPLFVQKVLYRQLQRDRNYDYSRVCEKQYWMLVDTFIGNLTDEAIIPKPRDLTLYTQPGGSIDIETLYD